MDGRDCIRGCMAGVKEDFGGTERIGFEHIGWRALKLASDSRCR